MRRLNWVLLATVLGVMSCTQQSQRDKWTAHFGRGEGKLKPGDVAPDFDLKIKGSEERVRLSDFKEKKAVALVFGSYT